VQPAPPPPDFEPNPTLSAPDRKSSPRIVVELPAPPPRPISIEEAAPLAVKTAETGEVATRDQAKAPAPRPEKADDYSYSDDLRDLVGSGWRYRLAMILIALALLMSVAVVYYEVHHYVAQLRRPVARVAVQAVNLREGPSPSAPVIAQLPQNTRLRILSQSNADWWEVEVVPAEGAFQPQPPQRGWVHSRLVAIEQ
jgi:hypothetical protein